MRLNPDLEQHHPANTFINQVLFLNLSTIQRTPVVLGVGVGKSGQIRRT